MSAGDPADFDVKLMEVNQGHKGGGQDLLDTEEEYFKEKEHSKTNPPTADSGDSKIQEDEVEKLLKQLDLKCKVEASSTEEPATKNEEDYEKEKDKDELQLKPGNGCDLPNYPSTQTLSSLTEKSELEFSLNEADATAFSFNAIMAESLEKEALKNPLLLIPVVRCVLKFLNIEDIKNCRLVCREWGSIGKPVLASRALIHFHKYEENQPTWLPGEKYGIPKHPIRVPVDFESCFLDSTCDFSAFEISAALKAEVVKYSWTIEELDIFFAAQQKYIKELKLEFEHSEENLLKKIDLGSWISKSPMVLKDTKYLTKLAIEGVNNVLDIRPVHLIAHIKDLSLSNCNIHVDSGIKIDPTKLRLSDSTFYQDGIKLDRVRINDIIELGGAKEVTLRSFLSTKYVFDLWGSATLEKLILIGFGNEIVHGETSRWEIKHLATTLVPYSLNSQMKIKELCLSHADSVDLFTLPTSIRKLVLHSLSGTITVTCSQPIVLQNLQYLKIFDTITDLSVLSHFVNCPQLAHLKLHSCIKMKIKSAWIPPMVKTLTLKGFDCRIKLLDENFWNLETLVVHDFKSAKKLCKAKIQVDNFVVLSYAISLDKSLTDFLENRKRFSFGKRLYIGELNWNGEQLENTVFKEYFDEKSPFYVFQDGQKGRAVSRKDFHALIPKHIDDDDCLSMN